MTEKPRLIRLSDDEWETLQTIAKAQDRSVTSYIRQEAKRLRPKALRLKRIEDGAEVNEGAAND
jgi:predicted transcriptional regulator